MQIPIPCTIMRGGTSRGVFFKEHDLPSDVALQDRIILAAFGSPDPYARQINGLGGATSSTSKVAIVGPRAGEPGSINYTFGQVSVTSALVDRKGNCGNISSAVGPYAVDEGMVDPQEPEATVRIYNTNTRKHIIASFPVENGKAKVEGDCRIAGVPGTGARVSLGFQRPGGAVTGRLLPTGKPRELLATPFGSVEASIVDAANPFVFVRAQELGLKGWELPGAVDADPVLLARLESIRAAAAVKIGLARDASDAAQNSPTIPKIAFVSLPVDYPLTDGSMISAGDLDLCVRMISMGKLHGAYPATGAICTAAAAFIEGTIVQELVPTLMWERSKVRLGHPSGDIALGVERADEGRQSEFECITIFRTARRLMDGVVYVPSSAYRM